MNNDTREPLGFGLFPEPKSPEQKAEEIVAIADLLDSFFWHPLWLLVRWPLALSWVNRDPEHDFHELPLLGKVGFMFLCMFGFLAQIAVLFFLYLLWLLDGKAGVTGAWISGVAFICLTVVRLLIGARCQLKRTT